MVNDPSISASEVAKIISQDMGISTKVLQLANSAFYGIPRTISTVQNALVLLGMKVVANIVLGIAVNQNLRGHSQSQLDQKKFWNHSMAVGILAKKLAPFTQTFKSIDPEEAFCAGFLHNLGILVLDRFFPTELNAILRLSSESKIPLTLAEVQVLGVHSGQIGGWLTSKWELPANLRMPIQFFAYPETAPQSFEITTLVALSHVICTENGFEICPGEITPPAKAEWFELLGLQKEKSLEVLEQVPAEIQKMESILF